MCPTMTVSFLGHNSNCGRYSQGKQCHLSQMVTYSTEFFLTILPKDSGY